MQNVRAVSSFINSGNYDGWKIEILKELINRRDLWHSCAVKNKQILKMINAKWTHYKI